MVADYESFISEATGQTVTLERSSVHRMELYAAAAQIYQAMQYIDRRESKISEILLFGLSGQPGHF